MIEHDDPAATEVPHMFVWEKSPLLTMLLILRLAVPVLVRVMDCGELLVPTKVPPKLSPLSESVTDCERATPGQTSRTTNALASVRRAFMSFSLLAAPLKAGSEGDLRDHRRR